MLLLKNRLTPEIVMLTSAPVEVPKSSLKFRSWTGEPVDTYGGRLWWIVRAARRSQNSL